MAKIDDRVTITIDINEVPPCDVPVSFICGKDMIEQVGMVAPKNGILVYLYHDRDIRKHGNSWTKVFKNGNSRIRVFCLGDGTSYESFISEVLLILKTPQLRTWDMSELSKIGK